MALIYCCECGEKISDKAEACPHCGYRLLMKPQRTFAEKRKSAVEEAAEKKREIEKEYKTKFMILQCVYIAAWVISAILAVVALYKWLLVGRYEMNMFFKYGYYGEEVKPAILLFAISVGIDIGSIIGRIIVRRNLETMQYNAMRSVEIVDKTDWWTCPKCGRENPGYVGTCDCGTSIKH